jgi:hypothetical protein
MISGAGKMPEMHITSDMMIEMPLHNYHDLPRNLIEAWCVYFESCDGQEKTQILKNIWDILTSLEQTAVIADLRLFLGLQMQQHAANRDNSFEDHDASIE